MGGACVTCGTRKGHPRLQPACYKVTGAETRSHPEQEGADVSIYHGGGQGCKINLE